MGETWEARMAERARQAQKPLERIDACEIGDPDMPEGHRGHHMHVAGVNGIDCSCGQSMGCFSVVIESPPPEGWEAWEAARSCSLCGRRGVVLLGENR